MDLADLAYDCKREVATTLLPAEVARLERLARSSAPEGNREVLLELLGNFPVYRAYPPDGADHVAAAVEAARLRRPDLAEALDTLAGRLLDPEDELAVRFAQVASAVMAKGVEDTAYYRWTRFVALNEVGGDPALFGLSLAEFHAAALRRQVRHPEGMTTLSTHDTKRATTYGRGSPYSRSGRRSGRTSTPGGARRPTCPTRAFAHLLWQTVAGAWPIERDRLHAYVEKAVARGRHVTRWDDPDAAVRGRDARGRRPALRRRGARRAAHRVRRRHHRRPAGERARPEARAADDARESRTPTRATELWDNSLVDPDNRRPVDFARRRELLARLDTGWLPPVDDVGRGEAARDQPGAQAAAGPAGPVRGVHRRSRPRASGSEHVVAFDRGGALTVATRLPVGLARRGGWRDTVPVGAAGSMAGRVTGSAGTAGRSRSPTCWRATRSPSWRVEDA